MSARSEEFEKSVELAEAIRQSPRILFDHIQQLQSGHDEAHRQLEQIADYLTRLFKYDDGNQTLADLVNRAYLSGLKDAIATAESVKVCQDVRVKHPEAFNRGIETAIVEIRAVISDAEKSQRNSSSQQARR